MCNDTTVSKLKNDFHYTLSKFSHELRNPLTLINSGLQMIASAHPEVKEYEHWDDVMDNLDYVKELLDELSAFNNAGHIKRENIDTCSYLRTILSSIKPTLDYLEITLETDIPDSLPSMALDRIRVRQMLLNLLKNAWEAVPIPGGKISYALNQRLPASALISRITDVESQKNSRLRYFSHFLQPKNPGPALALLFQNRSLRHTVETSRLRALPVRELFSIFFWDDKELQRSGNHSTNRLYALRYPRLHLQIRNTVKMRP